MPEKTTPQKPVDKKPDKADLITQVASKIKDSENVLVALSKNPSVDELAAALGLTFIIDKLGKHATAIFSGAVPNAIEFLEPEKTFESNTNSLQDFIIALDKEKADHLRYKIEGDFVKVFITPYKTTLSEKDLEFSHGDYNVDLIVALNVDAETDLDSALSEYGKIKHDASSINISAAAPGKFADLEWGNPEASSVSEMVASLADILDDGTSEEKLVDKSTATALLAGIVAATNRFSNEHTSAETMSIASELMNEGADQQLISSSIPVDILTKNTVDVNDAVNEILEDKEPVEADSKEAPELPKEEEKDPTELEISREKAPEPAPEEPTPEPVEEPVEEPIEEPEEEKEIAKKPEIVPDLPAPEPAPIEPADETPITPQEAPSIESTAVPAPAEAEPVNVPTPELEPLGEMPAPVPAPEPIKPVDLPPVETPAAPQSEPTVPETAIPIVPPDVANAQLAEPVSTPPVADFQPAPTTDPAVPPSMPPAIENAEYVAPPLPMPGDGSILPPPPAPIGFDDIPAETPMDNPAADLTAEGPSAQDFVQGIQDHIQSENAGVAEPIMPMPAVAPIEPAVLQEPDAETLDPVPGTNQVMQDQVYGDPGAFQIPGM